MAHRLFADWHRSIEVDPNPVNLEGRWAAIEAFVAQLTADSILALVRLAHKQRADLGTVEAFEHGLKKSEPAFPIRDNERLMAMLAAAASIHALSRNDKIAVLAAYSIDAAARIGWSSEVPDITGEARTFLAVEGDRLRSNSSAPSPTKAPQAVAKAVKDVEAATDLPTLVKAVSELGTKAQAAITLLSAQLEAASNWTGTNLMRLEEESDMMWWLLSGSSRLLGKDWADTLPSGAAIVGAWELASLIRALPGPTSAERLLIQLVRFGAAPGGAGDSSIGKAVAQLPTSMTLPELSDAVADLTPILGAVHHKLLSTGIVQRTSTPFQLGAQAYVETLLVRANAEAR